MLPLLPQTEQPPSRYILQCFYETLPSTPPDIRTTDAEWVQAHKGGPTRDTPSRVIIGSHILLEDLQTISNVSLSTNILM